MGNTIFFWKCIGIAQYCDHHRIGYWQYVSIYPKSAFGGPKSLLELDFWLSSKRSQGSQTDHFGILIKLQFITKFEWKIVTLLWSMFLNFTPAPPKCCQKGRLEGTLYRMRRTRQYRNILGPIFLHPNEISYWADGALSIRYCQYYPDFSVSITTLRFDPEGSIPSAPGTPDPYPTPVRSPSPPGPSPTAALSAALRIVPSPAPLG